MCGVGGVLAWVMCKRGWHGWLACVSGMLACVAWVACWRGWRASVCNTGGVGGMLLLLLLLLLFFSMFTFETILKKYS